VLVAFFAANADLRIKSAVMPRRKVLQESAMAHDHEFGRRAYPPQGPTDPTLDQGTVGPSWKWAIAGAIAVVVLLSTYGMTSRRDEQHAATPPAATGSVPHTASGRTTPSRP